jgi:predicted NBD/HSP70 family sugar kinase
MPNLAYSNPPALTESAKAVLRLLVRGGPSTRPQLGAALGLSRPTMSAAIAELERLGYVDPTGAVQGPLGRSATQYRVGRKAGHVIAVDAGSTHVRLRVTTLDGRLLHSRVCSLPSSQFALTPVISRAVAHEVNAAIAERFEDWGPLRALGIAVPTRVVGPEVVASTDQNVIFSAFEPPADVDVLLVNNVNCSAVAEREYGAARGRDTFVYVQIGLKIGMGLVLGGNMIVGANGSAGEIGHLSFPFAPGLEPEPGAVERYLGTESLIARVRTDWPADNGAAPTTTSELLAMAEAGNPAAMVHVERHAAAIGALVASCVSVVDPGLVVLGGGLGASPLLLPKVREVVGRLTYPVMVATTQLGVDATVLGVAKLTLDRALDRLLGDQD